MRRALSLCIAAAAPALALGGQELPPDTVSTMFVTDTIEGFGSVGGVVTDALGFIYIADFQNSVWRVTPDGDVAKFAEGLYGASGNALGPRGNLFQSSFYGNYVARITRAGELEIWADEGFQGPVGIAAAPDGSLYVVNCSGGYVSRIAPDRSVERFAESELMACPNGITFDDRGDLYVVNFSNTKVLRITPSGEVSEHADIPGSGGNGHIAFTRGSFYVTKFRGNQVFRMSRDGSYSVLAGSGADGQDDGPALEATFTRPNGIAAGPGGRELFINELLEGAGVGVGPSVTSLRRIRLVTLPDVLADLEAPASVDEVRRVYDAYHRARPDEDTSGGAIALAYQWMSSGRVAEGVALFQLTADRFDESANAQFHAGEAYRYTGQPDQAASRYRKALALQPEHALAAARLEEVTG